MKSHSKILIAFIFNFAFSLFELFGGFFIGSIAIVSDALHDFGDAASIGISFVLEKKSKKSADKEYTYGYGNYSVLGAVITASTLVAGGIFVIVRAIERIINPVVINYDGMIAFAIVGTIINLIAVYFTCGGESINQRAINLHLLEDVFGWVAVLVGAVIIKFTGFVVIDPVISIAISLFIIFNAAKLLKEGIDVFLIKAPQNIDQEELIKKLEEIDGVEDVHHIHLWTIDIEKIFLTMHVVKSTDNSIKLKQEIRKVCENLGINHITVEFEEINEACYDKQCLLEKSTKKHNHHYHSHHRH